MEITKKYLNKIGQRNKQDPRKVESLYRKMIDDFKALGLIMNQQELEVIVKNTRH